MPDDRLTEEEKAMMGNIHRQLIGLLKDLRTAKEKGLVVRFNVDTEKPELDIDVTRVTKIKGGW